MGHNHKTIFTKAIGEHIWITKRETTHENGDITTTVTFKLYTKRNVRTIDIRNTKKVSAYTIKAE